MEFREYRAEGLGADDQGAIEGLVTPFGRKTVIGDLQRGGFREEVGEGCFTKTLREGDALMVNQHNLAQPLARTSAGNLELREGDYEGQAGLVIRAEPVDTSYAQDLRKLVKAGVVRGMSFGFEVVKDEWFDDSGKPSNRRDGTHRVLREVKLIEVSPVTRPAYGHTAISARDESHALLEERAERASSVSAADRKALAAKGHALPDGSYPIPDKEHLHAAAVLAASGHGDVAAAKRLIRKRAKELGVDVNSLPGFGEKNAAADDGELRDDNEPQAHWCLKDCCDGAAPRSDETPGESRDQEPDASTPDESERALTALSMRELLSRDPGR